MPQLSYSQDMTAGFAGMIARTGPYRADTGENTSMAIAFGLGLARIAGTERGVALPAATGFAFAGVALHEHRSPVAGVSRYEQNEAVSVMTAGFVMVPVEQAVQPGDPVYLRHTANGAGKDPGQFRKDADTDKADAVPGARFVTKTAGAGLAVIELNGLV